MTVTAAGALRRILVPALACLVAGALGGLLLQVGAALMVGLRPLTILSGSMAPAISAGDLVLAAPISAADARPGEIITFRDPRSGHLITHRVRAIEGRGKGLLFTTKGDANNAVERWRIGREGTVSRAGYRIPKAGYLTWFARTPPGRIALLVLPVLLLGALEIAGIWRPRGGKAAGAPV